MYEGSVAAIGMCIYAHACPVSSPWYYYTFVQEVNPTCWNSQRDLKTRSGPHLTMQTMVKNLCSYVNMPIYHFDLNNVEPEGVLECNVEPEPVLESPAVGEDPPLAASGVNQQLPTKRPALQECNGNGRYMCCV